MTGKWVAFGLASLIVSAAWVVLSTGSVPSTGAVLPDAAQDRAPAQDIELGPALPQAAIATGPASSSIAPDKPTALRAGLSPASSSEPEAVFIRAIETTRALAPPAPLMLLPPGAEPRTLSEAIKMARTAQEKTPEYLGSAAMNPFASMPK